MRCKFCGWMNPDDVSICSKCGKPLAAASNSTSVSSSDHGGGFSSDAKKTVIVQKKAPVSSPTGNGGGHNNCPNCHYPILPSMTVCPQCKTNLKAHTSNPAPAAPVAVPDEKKTMNPYAQVRKNSNPHFKLTPIRRNDDAVELADKEFTGDSVQLNRDNTDPNNISITSKVQAVITFENGRWYVEDQSSQKTTFVLAQHKTSIQDGDVILLGDRRFTFKVEE